MKQDKLECQRAIFNTDSSKNGQSHSGHRDRLGVDLCLDFVS